MRREMTDSVRQGCGVVCWHCGRVGKVPTTAETSESSGCSFVEDDHMSAVSRVISNPIPGRQARAMSLLRSLGCASSEADEGCAVSA
jgi:hypothetical protein